MTEHDTVSMPGFVLIALIKEIRKDFSMAQSQAFADLSSAIDFVAGEVASVSTKVDTLIAQGSGGTTVQGASDDDLALLAAKIADAKAQLDAIEANLAAALPAV